MVSYYLWWYRINAGHKEFCGDTVAHFAHLGGAITGIIIILIWNKTNRKTFY